MQEEKSYPLLDDLKFFCAFLVIGVHTHPLLTFSAAADAFYSRDIANYTVPFFYACTGFLLAVRKQALPFEEKLKVGIRKAAGSYLLWTAVYFPLTVYGWTLNREGLCRNLLTFVRNFLLVGENYYSWTLWYLNGLIFCLALLWLLSRKLPWQQIFRLSSALYLLGAALELGREWAEKLPRPLCLAVKGYFTLFYTTRNGLFCSLVFVVLGIVVGNKVKNNEPILTRGLVGTAAALYALKIPLGFVGQGIAGQVLDLPTFYGIFCIVIWLALRHGTSDRKRAERCRYLSRKIYYVHLYFAALCVIVFDRDIRYNFLSFLIVSACSLGLAGWMLRLKERKLLPDKR